MFGTTCLSTGLYTVPSPYFAYTAVLGLANHCRWCSNNQVDAVFGSKRRGLRIGMQRDKDQNHGAPDTSVSGAYPFLGPVTGAQSAASHHPGAPSAPPASPDFPAFRPLASHAMLGGPGWIRRRPLVRPPPHRYRSTLFKSPQHRGENSRASVNDHG